MATIVRRGSRNYAYRTERVGGRTVSRYLGSGLIAEAEAERAGREREDRTRVREVRGLLERADRFARHSAEQALALAAVALRAAGYHKHHRGEWRRRRMARHEASGPGAGELQPADRVIGEILEFIGRADAGDADALQELRAALDAPTTARTDRATLVRILRGDAGELAEDALIALASGGSRVATVAMEAEAERLRAELEGPSPSTLERLLAGRVVASWLAANAADRIVAANLGRLSLDAAASAQKWPESANRRFLAAAKALATVRKLALPNTTVNVVQAVNLAVVPESTATRPDPVAERPAALGAEGPGR